MLSRDYSSSKNDNSFFTKSTGESLTALAVFVDDILLDGDNIFELDDLKSFLDARFKIKDLGSIHYFLGLEFSKIPQGYLMTQTKFVTDSLEEFHCQHFTPVVTPIESSTKLTATLVEHEEDSWEN